MTQMTRIRRLLVATLLAAVAGCGDASRQSPLEPQATPPADFSLGSLVGGLLSCAPLPYDSVSQAIGPQGGLIRVGGHSLYVPPGSLDSTVTITAVAPSGNVRMVRFGPEGLQFANGAVVTLSYENCSLVSRLIPKRVAYIDGSQNVLSVLLSFDNIWGQSVSGHLKHFSDYAVAW
jgi:hypothetical protein